MNIYTTEDLYFLRYIITIFYCFIYYILHMFSLPIINNEYWKTWGSHVIQKCFTHDLFIIHILLFVLTVSCNSIQNGSRFNICCILCLKLYYNCNERWDFNKILYYCTYTNDYHKELIDLFLESLWYGHTKVII